MHAKLVELKEKLEQLNTYLETLTFPNEDISSWNVALFPALHVQDLIYIPLELANKVSKFKKYVPDEYDIARIDGCLEVIEKTKSNVTNISSGQPATAAQHVISYLLTIYFIKNEIDDLFSFEVLANRELLPKAILNRLVMYDENLEAIKSKAGDIENKISIINEAYEAAEQLPTTLKTLRSLSEDLEGINRNSFSLSENISSLNSRSITAYDELSEKRTKILDLTDEMKDSINHYMQAYAEEAESYIEKCESAFRATTTKGLAGAFEAKAQKLNASIRWWVAGLTGALATGAVVGYFRLQVLEHYLSGTDASSIKLFIQLFLSFLSVGAPLWFAWLATKQIGQRFRLAEDYEFKASVSKAYEGYKKEAINLDESFSQRLFGNALTRLEEPPLRFVEESHPSSPLMEILSSPKFKEYISKGDESVDAALKKLGLIRGHKENKEPPSSTTSRKEEASNEE
ncbi:hypothetical protein NIM72_07925 [Pantoea sp. B550]|uniref:hypothetical protein n=1 Tax=Pantoea sp. B550 TaxID=2959338 RepID=UPI0020A18C3E|nr:hypothetical protein [Pantoea sp. B550]MCP1205472.1 hypothetical protein [Pantoea sp. B550]